MNVEIKQYPEKIPRITEFHFTKWLSNNLNFIQSDLKLIGTFYPVYEKHLDGFKNSKKWGTLDILTKDSQENFIILELKLHLHYFPYREGYIGELFHLHILRDEIKQIEYYRKLISKKFKINKNKVKGFLIGFGNISEELYKKVCTRNLKIISLVRCI